MKINNKLFKKVNKVFALCLLCSLFSLSTDNDFTKIQETSADSGVVDTDIILYGVTKDNKYIVDDAYSFDYENAVVDFVYNYRISTTIHSVTFQGDGTLYYYFTFYAEYLNSGLDSSQASDLRLNYVPSSTDAYFGVQGSGINFSYLSNYYQWNFVQFRLRVTPLVFAYTAANIKAYQCSAVWEITYYRIDGSPSTTASFGSTLMMTIPEYYNYTPPSGIVQHFSPDISGASTYFYDSGVLSVNGSSYTQGYADGYASAERTNANESYYAGLNDGKQIGVTETTERLENYYNSLLHEEYSRGLNDGYLDAVQHDSVVNSIFSGILQVGLLPINFFLSVFNFDILGINLKEFISAILTIILIIIVLKTILGSNGGD